MVASVTERPNADLVDEDVAERCPSGEGETAACPDDLAGDVLLT